MVQTPTITMRRLGRMGRWGNQCFQYMLIRSYAKRYSLDYQVPSWIGQKLFSLNDPPITTKLPQYCEKSSRVGALKNHPELCGAWVFPMVPDSHEMINHDFHGYAQYHTSYFRAEKDFLQSLFRLTIELQQRFNLVANHFFQEDTTVIGLHLRRGDTGRAIFYLTPNQWYLSWLEENWYRFKNPQLFISSEDPSDVAAFSKYNPVISSDLVSLSADRYDLYNYLQCDLDEPNQENMDWFPDWYFLTQCHVLLIGESTFGFSAAMLNKGIQELWRSVLSKQSFTLVDPWDAYPLVREHLDDYPVIPETRYTENPKWQGGEVFPAQSKTSVKGVRNG